MGLKALVHKHRTGMAGYEDGLDDWKEANGYDPDASQGYAGVPLYVLLPYNAADADAAFRVMLAQVPEL